MAISTGTDRLRALIDILVQNLGFDLHIVGVFDGVDLVFAVQPSSQVNVAATGRAERREAVGVLRAGSAGNGLFADRATHGH